MRKFEAKVSKVGENAFRLTIENRNGRKWQSVGLEHDMGNACESCMVLQEFLDAGEKLTASQWEEVK